MKIRIWSDTGANIYSKREQEYDLSDLGVSDEEWNEFTEDEREDFIRQIALENLDWGWEIL